MQAVDIGILPNVDKQPPFRELMKNKHKASGCTDELVSWIVKNIPRAETAVTFLSIPVKLGVERYLVSGFDCTFVQG